MASSRPCGGMTTRETQVSRRAAATRCAAPCSKRSINRGRSAAHPGLRGSSFRYANFARADLSNAKLTPLVFTQPDGSEWLQRVNLSESNFRYANLEGADLRHAILMGCDLSYASLKNADLRNADLTGAIYGRKDIEGARLEGAIIEE